MDSSYLMIWWRCSWVVSCIFRPLNSWGKGFKFPLGRRLSRL